VEAQMPLGDVHAAMVQETSLQSTGVTLVNNLKASEIVSSDDDAYLHL
jgi:hypothetical protein